MRFVFARWRRSECIVCASRRRAGLGTECWSERVYKQYRLQVCGEGNRRNETSNLGTAPQAQTPISDDLEVDGFYPDGACRCGGSPRTSTESAGNSRYCGESGGARVSAWSCSAVHNRHPVPAGHRASAGGMDVIGSEAGNQGAEAAFPGHGLRHRAAGRGFRELRSGRRSHCIGSSAGELRLHRTGKVLAVPIQALAPLSLVTGCA